MLATIALLSALLTADEPADTFKPDPSWKALGKDLWFDPAGRRLVIRARVAISEGPLEHLLCSKGSKDHESTLTTEAPPRAIHAGLLLTAADPGHPVRFDPKFEPPAGSKIAIDLE
ncbi:MAG TPA: YdjY domain-containing protein, partial [Isosphaeraceae bacterium]